MTYSLVRQVSWLPRIWRKNEKHKIVGRWRSQASLQSTLWTDSQVGYIAKRKIDSVWGEKEKDLSRPQTAFGSLRSPFSSPYAPLWSLFTGVLTKPTTVQILTFASVSVYSLLSYHCARSRDGKSRKPLCVQQTFHLKSNKNNEH